METKEDNLAVIAKCKRTKRPRSAIGAVSAAVSICSSEISNFDDEDMANCLILLAHGGRGAYECMTCNKSFPTFQALGGQRASHRNLKAEKIATAAAGDDDAASSSSFSSTTAGVRCNQRVYGCSICGSEFSSGQALGGHMRRHRQLSSPEKRRTFLALDLNLPAPPEETPAAAAAISFSAAALVGCHY